MVSVSHTKDLALAQEAIRFATTVACCRIHGKDACRAVNRLVLFYNTHSECVVQQIQSPGCRSMPSLGIFALNVNPATLIKH